MTIHTSICRFLPVFMVLLTSFVHASEETALSAKSLIKQELLLNNLITHLHFLKLDFQNATPREKLLETLPQLNQRLRALPSTSTHLESRQLLTSIHARWPLIYKHLQWLIQLQPEEKVPKLHLLTQALAKLDRQLLVLRQLSMAQAPGGYQNIRYAEHALMMQKLAREYIRLNTLPASPSASQQQQLQNMVSQFEQRMDTLKQDFQKHPHARAATRKAHMAWQFIAHSVRRYPTQPVPAMVAYYSDEVVGQLFSMTYFLH
ncbi:hypothetical protein [Candidatus Sororendozoicomonas aggregata]|uniref:hypothetical protein n=1 Tax=Candidatus Sororendozoicomonas aggregata TaxID=3073239 RepID=UPI002ECFBF84